MKIEAPSLEDLCNSLFLYMSNKKEYLILNRFGLGTA